ncbi:MAG: hypothetical protein AAEJ52_06585 [Myxococcota bacterium]
MGSASGQGLGSSRCLIASLVVAGALTGCSLVPWGPRALAPCPGVLRSIDQIDGEFVLQQRVRIRSGALNFPMRLVVQKTDDELVAIGFNPIGAKLFTVRQRSSEMEVDSLPHAISPFPPLSVLGDLHRIRFLAAPRPDGGVGVSTRSFDGTVVTDSWQAGSLVRRTLTSADHLQPTTLTFDAGSSSVSVDNPSCGYSSDWATVSEEAID